MTPDDPRHGTYTGAQTHVREKTELCDACRKARADYMRAYRKNNEREKKRVRAHHRAVQRLIDHHREEYERLYIEERLRDHAEHMAQEASA